MTAMASKSEKWSKAIFAWQAQATTDSGQPIFFIP
jgi:hypothetical protein